MGGLLKLAGTLFAYFSMATVLALVGGAAYFALTGAFTTSKAYRMLAVLQDVDIEALEKEARESSEQDDREQVSIEEVKLARAKETLNINLREDAIDKGITHLRNIQARLVEEKRRYNDLKTQFDQRLKKLEDGATTKAIRELQDSIAAMHPRQAKDQILRMIDDDAMDTVVTIVKGLPLDRRKKLFAEFKTDVEAGKLADILRQIRLGVPEATLIKSTRDKLKKLESDSS